MWYADLAPVGDTQGEQSVIAIGWLARDQPFITGVVERIVYERLVELLQEPWQPSISIGFHRCELCWYDGLSGKRNLFVPGNGVLYMCPERVSHYMNAHGYRPPDEFCDAVLACPPMRSVPYFKAVLANARHLVRSTLASAIPVDVKTNAN